MHLFLFAFAIGLALFSVVLVYFFHLLHLLLLDRLFLFFLLVGLLVTSFGSLLIFIVVFRVCLELVLADLTRDALGLDVNLFTHFVEPGFSSEFFMRLLAGNVLDLRSVDVDYFHNMNFRFLSIHGIDNIEVI